MVNQAQGCVLREEIRLPLKIDSIPEPEFAKKILRRLDR
ncbi:hypothetical protein CPter291_3217 [Collimonas pratensis]|uniref:Uncharacterized protein n=1 Tax=Collimonas pratensis TaxID=279113 RepID=A0ABM5Z8H7_9BURK|nr:hypothetical protein CPter291_3217 [Collimonas pratensis]